MATLAQNHHLLSFYPFETDINVSRLSPGVRLEFNIRCYYSYCQYHLLPQLELYLPSILKTFVNMSLRALIADPQKQYCF